MAALPPLQALLLYGKRNHHLQHGSTFPAHIDFDSSDTPFHERVPGDRNTGFYRLFANVTVVCKFLAFVILDEKSVLGNVEMIPHALHSRLRIEVQVHRIEIRSAPEFGLIQYGYAAAPNLHNAGILKLLQDAIDVD
jgi:hypothetical protein